MLNASTTPKTTQEWEQLAQARITALGVCFIDNRHDWQATMLGVPYLWVLPWLFSNHLITRASCLLSRSPGVYGMNEQQGFPTSIRTA